MGTADIFWWAGAGACQAACGRRLCGAWLGLLHKDLVHPTIAEVVFVGEALAGALDELVEIKLFVAVYAAFAGRFEAGILDAVDVEGMHVAVVPAHDFLDHPVQLVQGDAIRHQQTSPDRRLEMPQHDLQLQKFAWCGALRSASRGHGGCFVLRDRLWQAWARGPVQTVKDPVASGLPFFSGHPPHAPPCPSDMAAHPDRVFPSPAQQTLLREVRLRLIEEHERPRFDALLQSEHYLHDATLVGAALRYVAVDGRGEWIALLGYASACLHLRVRDSWLEWTAEQRERRRHFIAQQSRFLILPQERCPNLASRILKLAGERLREDFPRVYGHPVVVVESFVDPDLYQGTCYQAAGWQPLGRTAGWARAGRDYYQKHGRPKELWVQLLHPRAAEWLRAAQLPEALAGCEREPPPRNRLAVSTLSGLITAFDQLADPRRAAGRRHRLDGVLATAAVGVLAGGRTLADLAAIASELSQPQLRALRAWLNPTTRRREPPSESTFQRVLGAVDAGLLDRLLGQWLLADGAQIPLVCVDGKTLKGTDGLHLFSAFCGIKETVVAQIAVPEKTNEIPMLPLLLQEVPLVGTLVTADALHTQTDTARHLVQERGADYLLVVKDNQPGLREQCARLFPEPAFSPYTFAVRKRPRAHRDPRGPRSHRSRRRTILSSCRTSRSRGPPPRVLQRYHSGGDRLCHHQPLRSRAG